MHDTNTNDDGLVTVATAPTEFEANIKKVVLADAGIEANVFGSLGTVLGATGHGPRVLEVQVKVRASELDEAKRVLAANIADSVDIDWDEVDVGDRVDSVPLTPSAQSNVPAAFAMWVVALVLVTGVLLALAVAMAG